MKCETCGSAVPPNPGLCERCDQPPKPTFEDALLAKSTSEEVIRDTFCDSRHTAQNSFEQGARWGREYGKREALAQIEELFKYRKTIHSDGVHLKCMCKNPECRYELYLSAGDQLFSVSYSDRAAFEKLSGGGG